MKITLAILAFPLLVLVALTGAWFLAVLAPFLLVSALCLSPIALAYAVFRRSRDRGEFLPVALSSRGLGSERVPVPAPLRRASPMPIAPPELTERLGGMSSLI